MNNLPTRQESSLASVQENQEAVAASLEMLHANCKTYGLKFSALVVQGYVLVLGSVHASMEEFRETLGTYLREGKEFPTAGAFVDRMIESRDRRQREAEMAEWAVIFAERDKADLGRRLRATYGTEYPTQEQIRDHFSNFVASSRLNEVVHEVFSSLEPDPFPGE